MNIIIKNHSKIYQVQSVSQIFFPSAQVNITDEIATTGVSVISEVFDNINKTSLFIDGKLSDYFIGDNEEDLSYSIKRTTYLVLSKYTNLNPKWGMLTGIRPTKIVRKLIEAGHDNFYINEKMKSKYFVSEEKIGLLIKVCKKEMEILSSTPKESISLYIGIPFCPTKCAYCSFTSYSIKKYLNSNLVDTYVNYLIKELEWIRVNIKSKIDTIYIGGGTPTSLDEKNLRKLLEGVKQNINFENLREYTVEAGRPDTINLEKLKILKEFNVNRISINPQTMNDLTLKAIGRGHSVKEFEETFKLAKNLGFHNINVDLILGLPNEEVTHVKNTIEKIVKLAPSNITIHTLAIKRGSTFKDNLDGINLTKSNKIDEMLQVSYNYLKKNSYNPYYMYRQKNIVGNYENVGYGKDGYEGIYNVEIIEENQSIIAVGAGAVSKVVDYKTGKLERIFNFKSIEEYIGRFHEQLERKKLFKEMDI